MSTYLHLHILVAISMFRKAWPAAYHPPIYQGRSSTHLSNRAKAHDTVIISPTSQDSHDNVQTETMSAKRCPAQRERWTNIGNANIEESRDRFEKAVAESCGMCYTHARSDALFSVLCGVRMLEERSGEYWVCLRDAFSS
jgi:hypothetical protein